MKAFGLKLILNGFLLFLTLLPGKWVLALGRFVGRVLYARLHSRRQVALDNLKLVFGESLSPADRERLARENFAELGAMLMESLQVGKQPWRMPRIVKLKGERHLRAALAKKRGVIIFSGHMSNFVLLGATLSGVCDLKFLFRDPSDPVLSQFYRRLVGRLGITPVSDHPRSVSGYKLYKHVKSGKVAAMLVDQVETGGVYVDFMGHPAGSSIGAANLALRAGAPLVPVHCRRLPDQTLLVEIEPELRITRKGDLPKLIEAAVAATNNKLGTWVRAHPEQWLWAHRRWRKWRK